MSQHDLTRWRWRMRGAWQWPVFVLLTVAEAVLLTRLPVWGDGPEGGVIAAGLLAACLNLVIVAVLAPLAGMLLRLRRRDLPRTVASNYAGTALLVLLFCGLLAGGVTRTDDRSAEAHDRAVTATAMDDYIRREQPAFTRNLPGMDLIRIDASLYRGCVPGTGDQLPLCAFVDAATGEVQPDGDRIPNADYRPRW